MTNCNPDCKCQQRLPKAYLLDMMTMNPSSTITVRTIKGNELKFNAIAFIEAGLKAITAKEPDHAIACDCADRVLPEIEALKTAVADVAEILDKLNEPVPVEPEDPETPQNPNTSCGCGCQSDCMQDASTCVCKNDKFGVHVMLKNCDKAAQKLAVVTEVELPSKELYEMVKENYPEGWSDEMLSQITATVDFSTIQEDLRLSIANYYNNVSRLQEDVEFDGAAVENEVVIDLNGHNITSTKTCFDVKEGASLVIRGEGEVKAGEGGSYVCIKARKDSNVVIEGGKFSVGADANGEGNSCIEASDGTVTILGGEFSTAAAYHNFYYVLNITQTQGSTGKIIVKGGKFYGQDPAKGDDNLGGNFVAEGYKSVEVEPGVWEVVPE